MYVYTDKELNGLQYRLINEYRTTLDSVVSQSAIKGLHIKWLNNCADIHRDIFGGPRVNVNAPAPILFMFKQLQKKVLQYEEKLKTDVIAIGLPDISGQPERTFQNRKDRRASSR
jgi:hypothetical protein